jgi:DNA polymerase-3 subunit alpha
MSFSNKDFVHFHTHSDRSRFDGLAKLSDLVLQARKMGFPALALTDHGNVMGYVQFLKDCRATSNKKGPIEYAPIKPILGSEFYLARQMNIGQYEVKRDKEGKKLKPKDFQPDGRKGNRHLNIYAMNWEGYSNLCTLSQRSFTEGFYSDPRIDIELLSKHSKGLMGGSACLSSVINVNLLYGNYDKAKKMAGLLNEIFDKNFFLEVMYHGIPEEKAIIPDIFKLSSELNIPIIATNDTHYILPEHAESQEVLMCMSTSRCIKDPKRMSFSYKEFYLKSAEEMAKMFGSTPHVLTNSVLMADRVDTADIERNLFGGMRLPKFAIPDEFENSFEYLKKLSWEGLKKHGWDKSEKHIKALEREIEDVRVAKVNNNYDFATYFLIVKDYLDASKDMDILIGSGRGSGYASVMLRCLDITYGPDPLKFDLIWERFLGFDDLRFIKDSDFGFEEEVKSVEVDVLDVDRDLEDDQGGVDRY